MKILFIITILIISNIYTLFTQDGLIKLSDKDRVPFDIETLLNLKRLSSPTISPDGKRLLYQIKIPDISKNSFNSEIYILDLQTLGTKNLTQSEESESSPVWTKDSKSFYYISNKLGSNQVFKMNLETNKSEPITAVSGGIANLKLSPDNNYIIYTTEVKLNETIKDKYSNLKMLNAISYFNLPVREWDSWIDDKFTHIFLHNLKTGKSFDIMENEKHHSPLRPFGGAEQIAFSPDGKEIAYTSKKVDNPAVSTNSDIFIYNIDNKETVNITKGMVGYDKNPLYSPDGKYVAFHSQERAGFEADKIRIMLFDRLTKQIKDITKNIDQWAGQMVWSKDSKSIYFTAGNKGTEPLHKINIETGDWEYVTNGRFNDDSGLDINYDGNFLVFGRRSMTYPVDFYKLDLNDNTVKRLTKENDNVLMKLKDIQIEERWIDTKGSQDVHTWVLYPPDFDSNKKYPMITYCQGGPQGTISQYFSYRWNLYLMASKGYVVVAPNRRGMPGFGQEWNDAISRDWGGYAMQDILYATDNLAKEPFIDKNRIGAVGASFGGYTVFWLEGNHEKRFSAFISHCGVFNLESMYGSTEELFFPNWEFGGPYWNTSYEDDYEDFSPHRFVNKWDTPIMIITGMNDFRVPYTQSLEAYTAAQVKGLESQLLVFPDENHWVLKLQNSLVWHNEFFKFLDKYLK